VDDGRASSGEGVQTGVSAGQRAGIRTGRHWLVFFGIAVTIVILDQLTKALLVANLDPGQIVSVVGDYIRLVFSQNSGALFGLFRDQAILFAIASLVVIGLIVAFHGQSERSLYLSIALGLLLGGAIGNMIDRLRLGYVVDFVDIGIGGFRWYTFNLADAAISTALVMLFAVAFIPRLARLGERTEPSEPAERPESVERVEGDKGG
jgi:signal peptidase II